MLSGIFISVAVFAVSVLAAPTQLLTVNKYDGETTGRFIVQFKEGADASSQLAGFRSASSAVNITDEWDSAFFNGFAAELDDDSLNALRASPEVEFIEEDGIVHTFATVSQTNAPWGLARISQAGATGGSTGGTSFTYRYDDSAGRGVDIYIIDTGILTTHTDFGGRARWGATFGGYANRDGNGHGTHVAGSAAGSRWGVAKAANLIAVKVLSDSGSGSVSSIVSGLNWVASQAASSGRPSIASLSLGGGASTALDNAVSSLISRGVHATIAAGNSNTDASSTSPARVAAAITVGASTITDARASFSNYGSVVDIFAPGANTISAWYTSNTATNSISGTSMATPHVAGLVAYIIGRQGNAAPATIATRIRNLANTNRLSGLPSGTGNRLARNDI